MLVLAVQLYVMGLAQSFLIVIVNMKYYIVVFIVHDSVFQIWIVSAGLISICFFECMQFMVSLSGEFAIL